MFMRKLGVLIVLAGVFAVSACSSGPLPVRDGPQTKSPIYGTR
jgi:hypothetical protein